YLNGWGQQEPPERWTGGIEPPPGWDHWFGLIDPSTYQFYGYRVSDDGRERTFGTKPEDYQTDVFGAEVERTIERAAGTGKPWFVMWTPVAPHNGKA
ncbi:hypothetical protein SL626_23530, partial [Escherichia coli]|uniref:hypothetical protein n=1 Tax=Escherichia coli TaxID=562 RepID=UPI003862B449